MRRRSLLLLILAQSIAIGAASAADPLQGGVKQDGKLSPFIRITPNSGSSLEAGLRGVQQFAGRGTYKPGEAAPIPPAPKKAAVVAAPTPVAAAPPVKPPTIFKPPPKWNYTITPKSGIMSWGGAHSVVVVKPAARPQRLAPANEQPHYGAPTAPGKAAPPAPAPRRAPPVVPMMATAQMLPQAMTTISSLPSNWDEWYKRVSQSIFDQWNRAQTGPGTARLRVTVFRSHDVDCQVVDFYPAPDVQRDAPKETAFRETAIKAVYNLRKCEILAFPREAAKSKVCFDMDMKRAVSGPAGCEIAKIHE